MNAEEEQLEYAGDLTRALSDSGPSRSVYAQTSHGTHHFVVQRVEMVEHDGEDVAMMVLTAVEW